MLCSPFVCLKERDGERKEKGKKEEEKKRDIFSGGQFLHSFCKNIVEHLLGIRVHVRALVLFPKVTDPVCLSPQDLENSDYLLSE